MRWRYLLVVGLATALLTGLSREAVAHYVYDHYYVYESHENCTHVRSEISHGDGAGYRKVRVESSDQMNTWFGDYDCMAGRSVPANQIANSATLWRWNAKRDRWEVCGDPGYYYNPSRANFLEVAMKPYRDRPPCGDGYYGTVGTGYVVYNNKWYGVPVYSGYHWLPSD